jgi:hypothetical protein
MHVRLLSGALRSLAVAASHPDVIVGTGAGGLSGGEGERDEVRVPGMMMSMAHT